jgi:hypothetical protein
MFHASIFNIVLLGFLVTINPKIGGVRIDIGEGICRRYRD